VHDDDPEEVDKVLDVSQNGWPNSALHLLNNEQHMPFIMGDIIFAPSQVLTEDGITNVVAIMLPLTKPPASVPFQKDDEQTIYYTGVAFDVDSFFDYADAINRLVDRYKSGEI